MKVNVILRKLEPGYHICRKSIGEVSRQVFDLPLSECQEVRPDFGAYHPIVTFSAIERALESRGAFSSIDRDHEYMFGIAN